MNDVKGEVSLRPFLCPIKQERGCMRNIQPLSKTISCLLSSGEVGVSHLQIQEMSILIGIPTF